MKVGD